MSSVQRPASPSSSVSSTDSLPQKRIHVTCRQIEVGGLQFTSASEALLAYLRQFDLGSNGGQNGGQEPPQLRGNRDDNGRLGANTGQLDGEEVD